MVNSYNNQKILITQSELVKYAGSEIVTLELAEYFTSQGAKVDILTNFIDYPIKKEFDKINNLKVEIDYIKLDASKYDLIWIHHQLIPYKLLEQIKQNKNKAKIVFHHMSPYHGLEFPCFASIEQSIADKVLYNSAETKKSIEDRLGQIKLSGEVFSNPSPDAFYSEAVDHKNTELKNLLVVSSHIPEELNEAISLLQKNHIDVKVFGEEKGNSFKRITPEEINWADTVLSIGKTVQYSIVNGTPVYCYDHFGGPGYLKSSNINKVSELNFSGRGFGKKEAQQIYKELIDGYAEANNFAKQLREKDSQKYLLSSKMSELFNELSSQNGKSKSPKQSDLEMYYALSKHLWDVHGKMNVSLQTIEHNQKRHASEIQQLLNDKQTILESNSWKLTWPLRKINDTLKSILNKT